MSQADPFAQYRRPAPTAAAPDASADPFAAYRRPATPLAAAEPAMTLNPAAGYYGGALEAAKGFVKRAGRTAASLGGLVHQVPGISSGVDMFWDALYGDDQSVVQDTPNLSANAFTEAARVTEPTNRLQRVGAGAEQIAEFLAPGAIGEKTAAAIAAKAAPYFTNAPRLVQAGVKLAPRMVNEAAKSAGVAAAQGGDPVTAAEFGAAGPVIGKAAGAGGRYLGKKASDLISSLNMLPASADDAIALAARAKIPISAATATGNPYVKSIQHMADRSLVGSVVAGRAAKAESEGLAALGKELAARAHPVKVSAQAAGSGAQKGVGGVVRTQKRAADTAYGRFREIEADPANLARIEPAQAPVNEAAPIRFTDLKGAPVRDIFLKALDDAKAQGFKGSAGELKAVFDDRLKAARSLRQETAASADEYGHNALLKAIRDRGGLRPYDKEMVSGAPAIKARGEYANLKQTLGQRVFREKGLALDDIVQQLSEDPAWGAVIKNERDLMGMLEEISTTPAKDVGDIQHFLRGTGVQPGVKWWETPAEALHIPMATDLSELKSAIRPIADKLAEVRGVTGVLLGPEGKAAAAIEAILKGPDVVSASVADSVLSDFKAMARTNNPNLRNASQGIAAKAVFNLEKAVGEAAERAGPEAVAARNAGRVATQAKYAAGKLLENLEGKAGDKSPVTAFRSMTGADDVGVGRLKAVLNKTPETKPLIARAVLDRLIDHPTATPGRALTNWQKIGDETKAALYTPDHVKDLDAFFKLRKMMADNVNPSGSAHTAVNYVKGAFTYANPLTGAAWHIADGAVASLLHSRSGVRLLTRGMRIPSRNTTASKAWAEDFTTMLARVGAGTTAGAPARQP